MGPRRWYHKPHPSPGKQNLCFHLIIRSEDYTFPLFVMMIFFVIFKYWKMRLTRYAHVRISILISSIAFQHKYFGWKIISPGFYFSINEYGFSVFIFRTYSFLLTAWYPSTLSKLHKTGTWISILSELLPMGLKSWVQNFSFWQFYFLQLPPKTG